ncbi:heat-inducible transcriptional repressor HrcA [Candidatus Thiosymbion oneisti]|uniref:heat-inducible transcriptional repressor HrcA n=1 Tax=Candidatus Thiosymbion oneisti TaxID=589554 RepID=UPI000ACE454E|nr:heat-inducible transcriptional repressor HrcA [Candidatus Thiosymbion oneisti]
MTSTAGGDNQVSERAQHFLKVLIERYIRDGQPVGSRTLSKETGLELSPATVRNVMADLEEMGLVSSPHISSGRVPTDLGYRLFIDSLLTVKRLAEQEVAAMRRQLNDLGDASTLIERASQLLSGVTRLAGVVMMPRHEHGAFRQIEFLSLSGGRVLAILVTSEGEVHNRVVNTDRSYLPAELEQAANCLNAMFTGQDLHAVRRRLVADMKTTREHMDRVMLQAVEMAQGVVEAAEGTDDCFIAGQTNLMEFNELASVERLKQLFDAFTEKSQILHLLDRCIAAEGVQIFVGEESGYQLLDDCSLVTAPYGSDDQVIGVLGVIGPTRMNYPRVIPLVDMTARLLTAALKQQ